MLGSKLQSGIIVLLLITILAAGLAFYWSRNALPRQLWQSFFHFMVGQETKLNTAQFQEIQSEHYKIKFTEVDRDYAAMVAATAETAYTSVSQEMGWKAPKTTTIIIYPDNRSLAKSFGWDKDEKAMGVYWGGTIRILSPREWLKQPYDQDEFLQDGPMVHEFVHLMVDDKTGGNYNRWWTEGIAQYVEKKITGFEFDTPSGGRPGQLYSLTELEKSFDSLDQQMAYWESLKVIEYIVDEYGETQLYVIMDYLGQGYSISKATEKATGIDFKTFAYQCYQYMEKQ